MKKYFLFLCLISAKLFAQDSVSPAQNQIDTAVTQKHTETEVVPETTRQQTPQNPVNSPEASVEIFPSQQKEIDSSVKKITPVTPTFFDSLAQASHETDSEQHFLQIRSKQKNYILPVILFLLLLYFTILRYQYAKQLRENITVLFNMNLGQQIFRDREFSLNIFGTLLYINAVLVIGIYVYQLSNYFQVQLPFETVILNVAVCVAVFPVLYMLRSVVYFFIKAIFNFDVAIEYFRFNALIIYQLLAVALLPFVILMASVKEPVLYWVVFVSLCFIALALFIRFVKGFFISTTYVRFHIFYFLLYICALEIAPLLIVYKAFTMYAV